MLMKETTFHWEPPIDELEMLELIAPEEIEGFNSKLRYMG